MLATVTFPDISTSSAGNARAMGPTHARSLTPRFGVTRIVALVLTGLLACLVTGVATAMTQLTGNIDTASTDLLPDRPEKAPTDPNSGEPVNLLIMGSDNREGVNGEIGGQAMGERSDTTILLHISGDRSRVEAISIPRDTTVDVPSCTTTSGTTTAPESRTKFNKAFANGSDVGGDTASGALCAMQTVEALTGVYLDGFMVIDFQGFEKMIEAVDGVDICVEEEIYSPKANNLHLMPGTHRLDGKTALDFARARYGIGDGGDLGRIERQQQLLDSLVREVLSADTLANPAKTLSFLEAVTSSMTMDEDTAKLNRLSGLLYSLRGVKPESVVFETVPNGADPYNSSNVLWTPEADQLWEDIKYDRPISVDGDEDPDEGVSAEGTAAPAVQPPNATKPSMSNPTGASQVTSAPQQETIRQKPLASDTDAPSPAVNCG